MGIDPEEYRIAMAARGRAVLTATPPRAVKTRKERDILAAVLAYLRLVPGVTAWRNNSGAAMLRVGKTDAFMPVRFGFKGLSDIGGWIDAKPWGRPLYIECKREGAFPTREQQAFLDLVRGSGGIAIVARNVDDVRRVLQP